VGGAVGGFFSGGGGGARLFRTRPYRPRHPHILLYSGYWVYFTGVKQLRRSVDHLPLAPTLCMGRALSLSPVWSLTGCYRVTVTCVCVYIYIVEYYTLCISCYNFKLIIIDFCEYV